MLSIRDLIRIVESENTLPDSNPWVAEPHTYRLPLGKYYRVPLDRKEWAIVTRAMNVRKAARSYPATVVQIADLLPEQNWVHRGDAENFRDASEEQILAAKEAAIAVKKDGKLYLVDGHHRYCGAWLAGRKTMTVRLIDFDVE